MEFGIGYFDDAKCALSSNREQYSKFRNKIFAFIRYYCGLMADEPGLIVLQSPSHQLYALAFATSWLHCVSSLSCCWYRCSSSMRLHLYVMDSLCDVIELLQIPMQQLYALAFATSWIHCVTSLSCCRYRCNSSMRLHLLRHEFTVLRHWVVLRQ